jgi:hypothetical protein
VDDEATRKCIARQYDNIKRDDDLLGELMSQLEEDGLMADTIVFLWSDHGEGLPRCKRWPMDSGTRIPLIVAAGKNVRAHLDNLPGEGEVSDDVASLIDLGPTVLSLCGVEVPAYMQGAPFVGPKAADREVAFATRDRFDEFYDMMRSVRDSRYRYVRNEMPELTRWLWSSYSFVHPAAQSLFEGHRAGTLTEAQSYLLADSRPAEELYDLREDPHEIRNLADDPGHAEVLAGLRARLDGFLAEHGDLGHEEESQMVDRFWPGRQRGMEQPQAPVPLPVLFAEGHSGAKPVLLSSRYQVERQSVPGPADLLFHAGCQGSIMSYRLDGGPWQVYAGPIRLTAGETRVRYMAERIGYRPSEEREMLIAVT